MANLLRVFIDRFGDVNFVGFSANFFMFCVSDSPRDQIPKRSMIYKKMYSLNSDFVEHAKIVEPLLMKWADKVKQIRFNVKVSPISVGPANADPIKELVINSFIIASNIYRELFGKDSYTAMNNITSSGHAYYGKRVELIELFGDDKSKSFVNCLIPQITISDRTTNKLTEFAKELMQLTSNPLYLLGDIVNDQ